MREKGQEGREGREGKGAGWGLEEEEEQCICVYFCFSSKLMHLLY